MNAHVHVRRRVMTAAAMDLRERKRKTLVVWEGNQEKESRFLFKRFELSQMPKKYFLCKV